MTDRKTAPQADPTISSSRTSNTGSLRADAHDMPWVVSRLLNGESDLHTDLAQRYPNQPLMSLFSTHQIGGRLPRAQAVLSVQDGSASLTFEIDVSTRALMCTFTLYSMLSLQFDLASLNDGDRTQWLDHISQRPERPLILWSKNRWRSDYLVWSRRQHFTNLYAFSPLHIEAAARLTSDVMNRLMMWLAESWGVTREQATAQEAAPAPAAESPLSAW
ncbi:MAG: hypothetical protein SF123_21990 [Chloroflexota bacterium]|nr:hypothetical protein [Chloroflexota bacterium]